MALRGGIWRLLFAASLWLGGHVPAAAAVEIAFYSREMTRSHFPHAFIRLSGMVEATGAPVETSYGFTARSITPALLLGSVSGRIIVEPPERVAISDRRFALIISDRQYGDVLAAVERWRSRRQPSYNLNRRNCVHFVEDVARTLGLRVEDAGPLMKRPRAFLDHVRSLNPALINTP